MNALDLIILLCCIAAAVNGAFKGLVQQLASLVGIVIGVWLSFRLATPAGAWLAGVTDLKDGTVARVIAFAVIFLLVTVGVLLLGKLLGKLLRIATLGWVDRILGAFFALCTAALVLGGAIVAFDSLNNAFSLVSKEILNASMLYGPLKDFTYFAFPFLKEFLFGLGGMTV